MPRFLHIADIHLGYDRYDSPERSLDFYEALADVVETHAIAEKVDFVVIAGDLFEHRNIRPNVLNQAQLCLQRLKDAEIPVLAIEGNHDNRPYGTKTSWLRYLASWDLLILLEPGNPRDGTPWYSPWDPESKHGGYLDLECGVRVIGSQWYGASAPQAIATLADAIQALPPPPGPTVMLFHHGLEGQIARYQGALRYADLLPLREAGVDYLALGHIHKNYTEEGWIFNPGSLEANNIEETQFKRGAYLVNIGPNGIQADLRRDYRQRPSRRLTLKANGTEQIEDIRAAAQATVQDAIANGQIAPETQPIVELRIEGTVGFDRLQLDLRELQQELQAASNALVFLLRFNAESQEFATPIADDASRHQIETEVFLDLLTANNAYRDQAESLTHGLIDLKERHLQDSSELELYELVRSLLVPSEPDATQS